MTSWAWTTRSRTGWCCSGPAAISRYKMIFPALAALERRGRLNVPVIGVARSGWTLKQFRARAADSVGEHGRPADRKALPALLARLRYVSGEYSKPATYAAIGARARAARAADVLPGDPAQPVSGRGPGARPLGLREGRPSRRREAVRARSRVGARAEPAPSTTCSTSRRSSASITTSARSRCRTCSCSASRIRSSSRSGTATTSRASRSRWPRRSASRGAGASTRRRARSATSSRTTCCRWSAVLAMEPPVATYPESVRDEKVKVFRADPAARARGISCAASTRATGRRPASRPIRPSRRSRRCACRSIPGAGTACRSSSARASGWRRRAPRCW